MSRPEFTNSSRVVAEIWLPNPAVHKVLWGSCRSDGQLAPQYEIVWHADFDQHISLHDGSLATSS